MIALAECLPEVELTIEPMPGAGHATSRTATATPDNDETEEQIAIHRKAIRRIRTALRDCLHEIEEEFTFCRDNPNLELVAVVHAAWNLRPQQDAIAAWIANRLPDLVIQELSHGWTPPGAVLEIDRALISYLDWSDYSYKVDAAHPRGRSWQPDLGLREGRIKSQV